MRLEYPRQWLALLALVIAGLASLATSPPPYTSQSAIVRGATAVGSEAAEIEFAVTIDWRALYDGQPTAEPTLYFAPDTASRVDSMAHRAMGLEVEVVGLDGAAAGWQPLPLAVELRRQDCEARCSTDYIVRIRQADPFLGPLVLRWVAEATVPVAYESPEAIVTLESSSGATPPPVELAAVVGILLGGVLAAAS